jgi:hypothetical protein
MDRTVPGATFISVAETRTDVPETLFARVWADPIHAPEHIALAASERHAPAAAHWLEDKHGRFAHRGPELARMAKRRHATLARFEGAATGIGGIFTVVPDLLGLAWIQSRLVFFIAASYGFDPYDPMRPAELLVLMRLYKDVHVARRALDGVGTTMAEAYIGSRLQREETLAVRLAKMVGKRAARRFGGRMIPFIAVAFNAVGNEHDTRKLADRAIKFYGG